MGNVVETKEKSFLFPEEVRKLLNIDNDEIKRLCKQVNVAPKKDNKSGKTFFLKDDVEVLKHIKELHERSNRIMNNSGQASTNPINQLEKMTPPAKNQTVKPEIKFLMGNIIKSQDKMVEKLSKVIDEKLDGIDEVIVELIKSKTENESLRMKLNELNKENHNLKKESTNFKSIGFGFYIKN